MSTIIISLVESFIRPALALPQIVNLAVPNINSSICYMKRSNGLTLNLDHLCGSQKSKLLSAKDQQFINEYLGLLVSSPTLDPTFIQVAQEDPHSILEKAAAVCNALEKNTESNFQEDRPSVDRDTLVSLSTEYYCREFAD